jgi:hypothetical protein
MRHPVVQEMVACNHCRTASVEDFLQNEADEQLLVLGVSIPAFRQHDVFRSHKVSASEITLGQWDFTLVSMALPVSVHCKESFRSRGQAYKRKCCHAWQTAGGAPLPHTPPHC